MSDVTLFAIPRNGSEELRLALSEYQGHSFLNLRIWFNAGGGEMRPGKQGVTVPLWAIPRLRDALDRAEFIAHQEGFMTEAGPMLPQGRNSNHGQPH